ncbi:hypothetical protein ACH5RR_005043 [Cinchona calisaya]|uniref:Sel1-like protein n=1 Tax=Cinchona calisaya TaxID=153742 RepID=A0ABD3AZ98_9GENT
MEEEESNGDKELRRVPLSEVVSECVKRWFNDALKEAKAGDVSMQVLVGQMYFNGYGVSPDAQKGRIWMARAARVRSSVWKVSNKLPGDFVSFLWVTMQVTWIQISSLANHDLINRAIIYNSILKVLGLDLATGNWI